MVVVLRGGTVVDGSGQPARVADVGIRGGRIEAAARFGLKDRGVLRSGEWADVAIFELKRFGEAGTLESANQLVEGVAHVFENGAQSWQWGKPTGRLGGRVLRRG
jgi:N-acyl-D-aspartate/D-glutamate deacylase